jgi:hypothetical protein
MAKATANLRRPRKGQLLVEAVGNASFVWSLLGLRLSMNLDWAKGPMNQTIAFQL